MRKLECWAEIPEEAERKAVMAWVRASDFTGYSEMRSRVSVSWEEKPDDPDSSSHYWGIIHFFEQYSEHYINATEKWGG